MYLIGVDIGGSHVGFGLIEADNLAMHSTYSTKIDGREIIAQELIQVIVDGCRQLLAQAEVSLTSVLAIGMGCPGQVNNNILIAAANFPKLTEAPLADMVRSALGGVHTKLINDADAAMSAEVWGNPAVYGKYQHVAMVTLGTGVGFGLILNGQIHQGASGLIEGGHMIVHSSGEAARGCGCGQLGCVEAYASASSTVLRMQECDASDQPSTASSSSTSSSSSAKKAKLAAAAANTSGPTKMDGKMVFDRYAMNDFNAVKVVEETGEYLALMVINICRVVDPQVIIFGGGLSKAGKPLLDVIKKHVKTRTWKLPTDVKLTLALTEDNGVIGAALAAKSELNYTTTSSSTANSSSSSSALTTSSSSSVSAASSPAVPSIVSNTTNTSNSVAANTQTQQSATPKTNTNSTTTSPPIPSTSKINTTNTTTSSDDAYRSNHSTNNSSSSWIGAFFAVSSVTLLALDIVTQSQHSGGSNNSSNSSNTGGYQRSVLSTWLTRGLLAGQVGVGAYALRQSLLKQDT